HRPPSDQVRAKALQVPAELGAVGPLERQPLRRGEPRELVALEVPVPAEGAVDVWIVLGTVRVLPVVGGEHAHVVTERSRVLHRLLPRPLIAAGVLRRVHVADREGPDLGPPWGGGTGVAVA